MRFILVCLFALALANAQSNTKARLGILNALQDKIPLTDAKNTENAYQIHQANLKSS